MQLFMNGEESGSEGRALVHVPTGPSKGETYELPRLGKANFENQVARPGFSRATVVAGLDDSTPGQVYIYIGRKTAAGSFLDRAGLTNGFLFGVRVPGVPLEDRVTGIGTQTQFELANLGDVSALNGAAIQAASVNAGVTEFLRPEDGAWDPNDPRRFYFNTTDRIDSGSQVGRSRLWRLSFSDFLHPEQGGTIEMLLDGTEGQQMLDNLAVDAHGNLILQEDTGNNAHLASIWFYDVHSDQLTRIAQHDPSRFLAGGANFLTQDEESSGVIDASAILGPGWFLLDSQAHYSTDAELVQGGQLLALLSA
ncbi:MAG: hypothetical protein IPJ19_05430 [Planctomycetes bacterium]|nr:hypothetical protein [Planctomycetota bacterium]